MMTPLQLELPLNLPPRKKEELSPAMKRYILALKAGYNGKFLDFIQLELTEVARQNNFSNYGEYQEFVAFEGIQKLPQKPKRKKREGGKWSEEAKKKNRLRRLEKRILKKYSLPFLLEEKFREEVSKKPEYFEGK